MIQAHNFSDGGVYTLCLTGDAQKVVTVGKDGSLACWNWRLVLLLILFLCLQRFFCYRISLYSNMPVTDRD